jgi:hypothetical protein
VRAASGQGHEGYYSTGKACLNVGEFWVISVDYVKIGPGLSIQGKIPVHCNSGSGNHTVDGCIIQCTIYTGFTVYGAINFLTGGTNIVKNCTIEIINPTGYTSGISARASGSQLYVYNCTIINNLNANAYGIDANLGVTTTSQNNYFNVPNSRTYWGAATYNKGANDATSNTDAVTVGLRSITYSTTNFLNITIGYKDFHLSNASALRGQGATLADVPIDYVGNTRTGYTYDIGAHQRNTSGSDVKTFYENISAVGVGRMYTTMALWHTAKVGNLVDKTHVGYDGYVEVAEIYGGGVLSTADLGADWIADQYHYIHVRAASGQGHEGYYNTSKACLTVAGTWKYWEISVGYTKIGPGLSIWAMIPIYCSGGIGSLIVDSCVIQQTTSVATAGAIDFRAGGTHIVKNCVIEGISNADSCPAIQCTVSGSQLYVYNCTIINNSPSTAIGIKAPTGTAVVSQNNYFHTPSGQTYTGAATYNKGANDATSNADAVTASLRNIAYSTANFQNVTLNSENLHLTPTSALRTKGADLYSLGITTDYEGGARHSGFLWDIGADQQSDIPLCWNYTAQYKNSNKLFKASGCGSFPKSLRVPNNVDTNTGKMVDDGDLIDPKRYLVE